MKAQAIAKHLIATLVLLSALALVPRSPAQGGLPLWTNYYTGPGHSDDEASAISVDSQGNVFVTGYSNGGGNYTTADYATVAYSNAGVPLWTNRYDGGNGADVANAITIDSHGNVFVTGKSFGEGQYDWATIAYSPAGLPLWTNRYDRSVNGTDAANAIALDTNGNVFVTGFSDWEGTGLIDFDYTTIKYSNTGLPLWTNRYAGSSNSDDEAVAIAMDNAGNVLVTGYSANNKSFPWNYDFVTIKYSNIGLAQWTNRCDGPISGDDVPVAIASDTSNNVCVTGYSSSSGGEPDYLTIKYSSTGAPLWTNRYDGPVRGEDIAKAIAVDSSNNVFVTGYSARDSVGHYGYATISYSSAGVPLWTNRYDASGNVANYVNALAVDRSGNVFVTGYSGGHYATVGYSRTGLPLWTNLYIGPVNGNDLANAIAVDASGNVFVTGLSADFNGFPAYATIKYSSSIPEPARLHIQRINQKVVLSWTNIGYSLQSASGIIGTFTNIPGAISPYTNSVTTSQQYFRLKANGLVIQ